jgi:hypothetical protein
LSEINRAYRFIVNIVLVAVPIDSLAAMATVMKEKTVIGPGVFHQPLHRADHVGFGWVGQRMWLVVRENHHIVIRKSVLVQESFDVQGVVDASVQLVWRAEIIYTD